MYQLYKYYLFAVILTFIYVLYYRLKYKKNITSSQTTKEYFDNLSNSNDLDNLNNLNNEKGNEASGENNELQKLQNEKTELLNSIKTDINILDNNLYENEVKKSKKILYEQEKDKLTDYIDAYKKYNETQKIKATNIDLLDVGNKIESGIIDLTYKIYNVINNANANMNKNENNENNKNNNNNNPDKNNNMNRNLNNANNLNNKNKLIKTNEKFNNVNDNENNDKNTNNTNDNDKTYDKFDFKRKTKKNKKYNNYVEYVFNIMLEIYEYIVIYAVNILGIELTEDNMIPSGILLIIIASGLFFIDLSS